MELQESVYFFVKLEHILKINDLQKPLYWQGNAYGNKD